MTLPLVSVIMPVHNEAAYIARSLGAVIAQTYPRERMEVLVIDGRSKDGTGDRVREIARQNPEIEIRVLDNPGRTAPCALNVGLGEARGEIIARVDGHCEIAPDYLVNGVRHLLEEGVDGVGGPLETIGETPTAAAIAVAMSSRFGVGGSAFRTDRAGRAGRPRLVDTVAFPIYTRQAVDRAGPFDEALVRNQDDEYNYRLRKLGGRILLSGRLEARYYSRSGFWALWRQYFQYGFYKVRVLRKHPRQMQWRQFVPPLFVLALVVSALAAPWHPVGRAVLVLVIVSYLVAISAAAAWEARRGASWPVLRVAGAMAILHLAYGTGFLWGLLR